MKEKEFEILTIESEVHKMEGQGERDLDLAESVNSREFKRSAKTSNADELKQQIEYSQKEADRLAWFATDEGKAYKQKTEKEMETIWDELNKLKKETHNYVQEIVHKLLGNSFDVVNFGHRGFKVYMTKGYTKEDIENCHFTPSFEIYHDKLFRSDISRWILSYASSGEFELGSDWIRTKFLVGLAKFVSDEEGLSSLIERMNSYYKQSNALEIELYRLNEELGYL